MTRFVGTPLRGTEFSSASDEAISARVGSDTYPRIRIDAGGRITWASGSATGDTTLYRDSANVLKTDDVFQALSGVVTLATNGAPTDALANGAIAVDTTNHVFYFRSNNAWNQVSGGGATLTVSDAVPTEDLTEGDLWYESDTGKTFVYYDAYWVEIGNSGGAVVADNITGNAATATKLQTARNIALTGDVTGTVSFDGSANASISTTIQANSVALGTDTTGNYMSDVSAGTGISVSHTPSEGSTATVSLNATLDNLSDTTVPSPASGDFLKWNGTAWVNDPINLGTDTVGNYMSDVSASTGISISHTPGEGSTATISAVAPMALTQSANNASYPLTISSANEQSGGTGYSDILKIVNSKSGGTNINKHLRLSSAGNLEIVNSAYTASLLVLTDAGALTVPGPITQTSYNVGDVIKTTIWSASDMGFTTNYSNATATYAAIASKTYTPASASSYILVEVYARYYVNGAAEDSFFSQLTWAGNEFAAQRQVWTNGAGGGTRSSTLFPLAGRITNSSPTGYTLAINARRDSADDTLTVYADNAFIVKITEVAR